ncbi:MAG: IclR family transcriptional regulator [Clostridia bacterium]|nr:IclR family transcriptional regulator [Clostridia bacterium]MCI2000034.1 IclR family transcriptional regulator [Clostridia bacterium]MCI2014432.1 IclR family transcriptional regulator [Clostridia bacterium]
MGKTKNIQSVERAFAILELFGETNSMMSVKEISAALQLSKSTVFGLINTLYNLGYLRQDSETLKYNLGPKVLALGSAVSQNDIIAKTSHKFMQEISDKFQETCLCVIEENGYVVYIDKTESTSSITLKTRIGTKKELYCTGVGKVYLAYMSEEKRKKILSKPMEKKTENTITDIDLLESELENVKKQGFAFDDEEFETGICCLAVPVFGRGENVISSISLTGPIFRIKKLDFNILVKSLKDAAGNISKNLML